MSVQPSAYSFVIRPLVSAQSLSHSTRPQLWCLPQTIGIIRRWPVCMWRSPNNVSQCQWLPTGQDWWWPASSMYGRQTRQQSIGWYTMTCDAYTTTTALGPDPDNKFLNVVFVDLAKLPAIVPAHQADWLVTGSSTRSIQILTVDGVNWAVQYKSTIYLLTYLLIQILTVDRVNQAVQAVVDVYFWLIWCQLTRVDLDEGLLKEFVRMLFLAKAGSIVSTVLLFGNKMMISSFFVSCILSFSASNSWLLLMFLDLVVALVLLLVLLLVNIGWISNPLIQVWSNFFTFIGAEVWEYSPQMCQNFEFWPQICPLGATRLHKFYAIFSICTHL